MTESSLQADGPLGIELFKEVVREHHPDHTVTAFETVRPKIRNGYTTYILSLDPPSTSFLTVSLSDAGTTPPASNSEAGSSAAPTPDAEPAPGIPPHTFELIAHLSERIRTNTSMPVPDIALGTCANHRYMLTAPQPIRKPVPLSCASLDAQQRTLVDLKLGQAFAQLHQNVQNDWFGIPAETAPVAPSLPGLLSGSSVLSSALSAAPSDTAYSWQETFTGLLEDLLQHLPPAHAAAIPLADIRACLSRAIGFYLFDDADVPALVTLTASPDFIYVEENASGDGDLDVPIVIPPALALSHSVYGDPLLEGIFLPPGPGEAFMEGYKEALIVFPRQRTKRMWYTLFFALLALTAKRRDKQDEEWALKMIEETVEALKKAPSY